MHGIGLRRPGSLSAGRAPAVSFPDLPMVVDGLAQPVLMRFLGGRAEVGGLAEFGGLSTLALQAGTAPDYAQAFAAKEPLDLCVDFNGAFYRDSGTTFGDLDTHDYIVEAVLTGIAGNGRVAGKWAAGVGWALLFVSGTLYLWHQDASGAVSVSVGALTNGNPYHVLFFMRRAGSGVGYVNSSRGAAVAISAKSDTLSNAVAFEIGASGGSTAYTGKLAWLGVWNVPAGMTTHLQDAVAAARFVATGI